MELIKRYLGRVIAGLVAGASAWVGIKFGINWALGAEEQAAAVAVLVTVVFELYSAAHRLVNGWLNPADAAAPDKVVIPEAVPK